MNTVHAGLMNIGITAGNAGALDHVVQMPCFPRFADLGDHIAPLLAGLSASYITDCKLESKLAKAQRPPPPARVRALHTKTKHSRKKQLHKLSRALVTEYSAIFIGNVNVSALAKTRMAKSVLDAG
jgi:hypothetical protein